MTASPFKKIVLLIIAIAPIAIWSAIAPHDRLTWWLETTPALLGLVILAVTFRRFSFTSLVYVAIFFHMTILFIGGHYTYAEVPFFHTIAEFFGRSRNDFDRVGHFAQGFVPALIAREILIRNRVVNGKRWLAFIVICACLALSATYELVEWLAALVLGQNAEAFLGTQGDMWDTQIDMFLAVVGASVSLLLLSTVHDKQLDQQSR